MKQVSFVLFGSLVGLVLVMLPKNQAGPAFAAKAHASQVETVKPMMKDNVYRNGEWAIVERPLMKDPFLLIRAEQDINAKTGKYIIDGSVRLLEKCPADAEALVAVEEQNQGTELALDDKLKEDKKPDKKPAQPEPQLAAPIRKPETIAAPADCPTGTCSTGACGTATAGEAVAEEGEGRGGRIRSFISKIFHRGRRGGGCGLLGRRCG